jgi:hypothetical protein
MNHGGHSIIARGLYALQLEHWMEEFPVNQIYVMSIAELKQKEKKKIQASLDNVFTFVGLPPSPIEDFDAKNTRNYDKISLPCRERLEDFYRPYNERLFTLLEKRIEEW